LKSSAILASWLEILTYEVSAFRNSSSAKNAILEDCSIHGLFKYSEGSYRFQVILKALNFQGYIQTFPRISQADDDDSLIYMTQ